MAGSKALESFMKFDAKYKAAREKVHFNCKVLQYEMILKMVLLGSGNGLG